MITLNEDIVWDDVRKAEWILRNNWHPELMYYYYNTSIHQLTLVGAPPWVAEESAICEEFISILSKEKARYFTGTFHD